MRAIGIQCGKLRGRMVPKHEIYKHPESGHEIHLNRDSDEWEYKGGKKSAKGSGPSSLVDHLKNFHIMRIE